MGADLDEHLEVESAPQRPQKEGQQGTLCDKRMTSGYSFVLKWSSAGMQIRTHRAETGVIWVHTVLQHRGGGDRKGMPLGFTISRDGRLRSEEHPHSLRLPFSRVQTAYKTPQKKNIFEQARQPPDQSRTHANRCQVFLFGPASPKKKYLAAEFHGKQIRREQMI